MKLAIIAFLAFGSISHATTTTVLNPGDGKNYLGVWCGGQTVNEYALGFNDQGNADTLVKVTTRCAGSGRGAKSRTYVTCTKVTFQLDGTIVNKQAVNSGSYLQGSTPVECAIPYDVNAAYENDTTFLSTDVIAYVYRAVVETP